MKNHILVQGKPFSLEHLEPFNARMDLTLKGGKTKKGAFLAFRFSCHCYTRGVKEGEHLPAEMLIHDGSKEKPRDRTFCRIRYSLSFRLKEKIMNLINENGAVQQSRHLNFFATSIAVVDEDGTPTEVPYYVFIMPKKKQDPNQPPRLDLFVESAYQEDPNVPSPSGTGRVMRLSEMLGEVWEKGTLTQK